jgi:two-component system nitrate/nitrite response regulator NarL
MAISYGTHNTHAAVGARIRILIVHNHQIIREALRLLLEREQNLKVVGNVSNCADALTMAARENPDIVLLDIDLNDHEGFDFFRALRISAPGAKVLILTGKPDSGTHDRAVLLGAVGIVLEENAPEILFKAIKRVCAGEVWLDRSAIGRVFAQMSNSNPKMKKIDPEAAKVASLTDREREVVALVGEGLRNKGIGDRLFISETTVRHHLTSIYGKIDIPNRLKLIIFAYRHGLAKPPL